MLKKRRLSQFALDTNNNLFNFLLNDTFTTDLTAGNVDGTNAEPGPGIRILNDTDDKFSLSSGSLAIAAGDNTSWTDPAFLLSPITLRRGTVIYFKWTATSNRMRLGLTDDPSSQPYWSIYGAFGNLGWRIGGIVNVDIFSTSVEYESAIIIGEQGAFMMHKVSRDWKLLWMFNSVVNVAELSPSYPMISTFDSTGNIAEVKVPRERWLPEPYISDGFGSSFGSSDGLGHAEGIADGLGSGVVAGGPWTAVVGSWGVTDGEAVATALSGGLAYATIDSALSNLIVSCDVTVAAGTAGIVVRWTDANNHVHLRHTGSNVQLVKIVAGVATTLVDTSATYVAGATLRLICDGTKFRVFYNDTAYGGEQTIADAVLESSTVVGLRTSDTGNTFDNFVVYARGTSDEYNDLDTLVVDGQL